VHFPRCRLGRRLARQVGFGAPRDSRAALWGKGPVLYRILDTDFYEKALFVKPTWRLPRGRVQRLRLPFARAMLLSALSLGKLTLFW
jgi:hypothetical protein